MSQLYLGDCLYVLKGMPSASVDSVVCDPPSGVSFMGMTWDSDRGGGRQWAAWLRVRLFEARRVAKPGAYMFCWALPRTAHWTGTAIEEAGWEIQEKCYHAFGSGFPKHKSKLKPSIEEWILAWNPDRKATLLPGLDKCRVRSGGGWSLRSRTPNQIYGNGKGTNLTASESHPAGRWPPTLLLSHSPGCVRVGAKRVEPSNGSGVAGKRTGQNDADGLETIDEWQCVEGCPALLIGEQSGERKCGWFASRRDRGLGYMAAESSCDGGPSRSLGDTGTAARFFPQFPPDPFLYCPKASGRERDLGIEWTQDTWPGDVLGALGESRSRLLDRMVEADNPHPTIKPQMLMRWLVKLITPDGGVVLDPFMGTASTGVACSSEGFQFLGIEDDPVSYAIAERRFTHSLKELVQ